MKLNKKAKNHFLGMQLLASNGKAAVFTDSNLDTIPCDIGVEELEELCSSRFLTPDRIAYVKKESQPSKDSIAVLGTVPTKMIGTDIFGMYLNFNLVFEIHPDTRVSDIVALFDPNIKNIVANYNIEDHLISDITVEQVFVTALTSLFSVAKKNCAKEFIAKHASKIQRTSIVQETYGSQQNTIFLVRFPNVRYYKKYNQYYVYKEDEDFDGMSFEVSTDNKLNERDIADNRRATEPISLMLHKKDLYLHHATNSSYTDSYALDDYTNLVNFCMTRAKSMVVCEKEFYRQKDIDFNKFNYKIPIRIPEASSILIEILNNYSDSSSHSFCTNSSLITRNIHGYINSFADVAQSIKNDRNKFTVNFASGSTKKASTLNLIKANKGLSEKVFSDRYDIKVHIFPYFSYHTHAVNVQKEVLSFIRTLDQVKRDNIKNKCKALQNIYNNNGSTLQFSTPYVEFFGPRNLQRRISFTDLGTSEFYNQAIEALEVMGTIASVAMLSCKEIVSEMQQHKNRLSAHLYQAVEGLDCHDTFDNGNIPGLAQTIQHSNFKYLLSKSSKKKDISNTIASPYIVNYTKNNLANFFIDNNYYNTISSLPPVSLSENTNFDFVGDADNSRLFDMCFRVAFFGRLDKGHTKVSSVNKSQDQIVYSIVDMFEISEEQLNNPSEELIEFFQVSVSLVSSILIHFLYSEFRVRRNYFGADKEFISFMRKMKNLKDGKIDVPVTTTTFKTLGSFLNSNKNKESISSDFDRFIENTVTDEEASAVRSILRYPNDQQTQTGIVSLPISFSAPFFSLAGYNGRNNLAPVFNPRSRHDIPSFFARNLLGVNLWYNNMQFLTVYKK